MRYKLIRRTITNNKEFDVPDGSIFIKAEQPQRDALTWALPLWFLAPIQDDVHEHTWIYTNHHGALPTGRECATCKRIEWFTTSGEWIDNDTYVPKPAQQPAPEDTTSAPHQQ